MCSLDMPRDNPEISQRIRDVVEAGRRGGEGLCTVTKVCRFKTPLEFQPHTMRSSFAMEIQLHCRCILMKVNPQICLEQARKCVVNFLRVIGFELSELQSEHSQNLIKCANFVRCPRKKIGSCTAFSAKLSAQLTQLCTYHFGKIGNTIACLFSTDI